MADKVEKWVKSQTSSAPSEIAAIFNTFLDLYDKKLWHQLTVEIEQKLIPLQKSQPYLIPLYENFISDWAAKMNKISLVRYAAKASKQFKTPKESLDFLAPFAAKLKVFRGLLMID